jgi:hypothetical protein
MANIYAAAGMREDAQTIKTMRLRNVVLQTIPQDRKNVVDASRSTTSSSSRLDMYKRVKDI